MTEIQKAAYDLTYLTVCGVNDICPDIERVKRMNLTIIFELSMNQSLDAVTCMALEKIDEFTGKLADKWKERKNMALRKNIMLTIERENLFNWLNENGIWYLPLKGIIIDHLYPKAGMRQMSDNDILFDKAYKFEVKNWFIEQGYSVESYDESNHDIYKKPPVLNFEMHKALFNYGLSQQWIEYWENINQRLVKCPDTKCGYLMTNEDFYIYIVNHSYKHFSHSGTGLRTLMDFYILLKTYECTMDWKYVYEELKKLGLSEYEEKMHDLQNSVFKNNNFNYDILTENQKETLDYLLNSGTYGTLKNKVDNRVDEIQGNNGKPGVITIFKYLKERIFLNDDYFKSNKKLKKIRSNPLLYTWFIIKRIAKGSTTKLKSTLEEIKIVFKKR